MFKPKRTINDSSIIHKLNKLKSELGLKYEVFDNIYNHTIDADIITKRSKEENINADVFGHLAFDNSVSKKNLLQLKK